MSNRVVVVAHPDDETLRFSSISRGALIVCITDGNGSGRGHERREEFRAACSSLGASESLIMDIPDVYPRRLPERLIAERLRSLGLHAGTEIYTHSPFDGHPHHRSVAFATSLVFPELKVEALASRPSEVHVLTEADFARKLHIVNSAYALEIRPPDEAYVIPAEAVAAIESFTHVTAGEVVRALALTQPEIRSEYPDMWGFDTSPYELERMEKTVNVMLQAVAATG